MSTATAFSPSHMHIESTPGVRGGRPRIQGTRITVADVAIMHLRQGLSLEEIAGTYDLSIGSVYAAMTYYHDHRPVMDELISADRKLADSLENQHPSLLKAKLAAANRG